MAHNVLVNDVSLRRICILLLDVYSIDINYVQLVDDIV